MSYCNICLKQSGPEVETAQVRSNVRKFSEERFTIWRCPHCASIHSADEVDLDLYYSHYPFHDLDDTSVDWMLRAMYRNLVKRLGQSGFEKGHSLIDYGCGSGRFVSFMEGLGHEEIHGFDEYGGRFADRSVLERRYHCVMTQDVIEHVPDPHALLSTLEGLCEPGGLIVVGTPNAEAIDLSEPEARVHTLHQPYHRHILSKTALLEAGQARGWELVHYYPTMYANTWVPFANQSFVDHYFKCGDNNMDLLTEPIHGGNIKLYTPVTLAHALLGAAWAPETDVMAVFRRPQ